MFGFLIGLSVFLIVYFTHEGIKTLDRIDKENDTQVVESLLQDRKYAMSKLLRDYSEWTDAYRSLYEREDEGFASENIAFNLTNNYDITGSSVLRFDKSIIFQYIDGKKSNHPKLNPMASHLADLMLEDFKARGSNLSIRQRMSFDVIDGKLYLVAAGFIAPLDDQTGLAKPLPKKPSMMVFERHLDDATLKQWADIYNISGMHFDLPKIQDDKIAKLLEKIDQPRFKLPLQNIQGDTIGQVSWQPLLHSGVIMQNLLPKLGAVLALLSILSLCFVFSIRRAFASQCSFSLQIDSNRKFLQLIFDTDPTQIQVRDKNGMVVFANKSAAERYGMTPDEFIGQSILKIDAKDDHGRMMYEDDLRAIVGNRELTGEEEWRDAKNRSHVFCTLRRPIILADGDAMVLSVASDITAQKQAIAELEQSKQQALAASQAKSEFLGVISHEIRTPMNGILGFTQLLSGTDLTPEQQEFISIIQNSSRNLLAIINDILDMSRIESGKMKLDAALFKPTDALDAVLDAVSSQAGDKNLRLVKEVYGEPRYAVGDSNRLQQILSNLVVNAIKFTESGSVTVRMQNMASTARTSKIKFEVIDTGIGIAPGDVNRLFQKFTQADSSSSRKFGGTGLGLAIARELCEMMGGEIGVQSMPQKGSHFWFTVQLKNAEA